MSKIDYTINTIPKYTRPGTTRLWIASFLTFLYEIDLIRHNTYIEAYNEATKFIRDGTDP